MASLLCPKCGRGTLKWDTPIETSYISELETKPMTCQKCGAKYQGLTEWSKIAYPELSHIWDQNNK